MTFRIEYRTGVAATPDAIWEILIDLPNWGAWNPIYPEAAGKVAIGGLLTLTETIEGLPRREVSATVVDWVPYEQLIWRESRGFQSRSMRFIEIEQLGPSSCILSNGEIFAGFFGEMLGEKRRKPLKAGFAAMGEALRARAEGLA